MKKFIISSIALLSSITLAACSSSSNDDAKTEESSTTVSSSSQEVKTLETYALNDTFLGEYEYDTENDVYIVSGNLGSSLGDKIAIESFNDVIYDALHQGFKTDKPVIFRGWYEQQDVTFAGTVIYFSVENFNSDWSKKTFDSRKTYQFADAWISASKFGQYQSSNNHFSNNIDEDMLYNIFQLSK